MKSLLRRGKVRKADGKVLGEGVLYGWSGGDFIGIGYFTSKTCPEKFGEVDAVIRGIFTGSYAQGLFLDARQNTGLAAKDGSV
jgi:hypothetical protein